MSDARIRAISLTGSVVFHLFLGIFLSFLIFPEVKRQPQLIEVDVVSSASLAASKIVKNKPVNIASRSKEQKTEEKVKTKPENKIVSTIASITTLFKDEISRVSKSLENQINTLKEKIDKKDSGSGTGDGSSGNTSGSSSGPATWGGSKIGIASAITPGTPKAEKGKGYTVVGFGTVKAKPEKATFYVRFKSTNKEVLERTVHPLFLTGKIAETLEFLMNHYLKEKGINKSLVKIKQVIDVEKDADVFTEAGVISGGESSNKSNVNVNVTNDSTKPGDYSDASTVATGNAVREQKAYKKKTKKVVQQKPTEIVETYEEEFAVDDENDKKSMQVLHNEIIAVETTDLDLVNPLLDYVISLGLEASTVNGKTVNYGYNSEEINNLKIQARKIAYDDAKKKAEGLVDSLGLTIKDTVPSVKEKYTITEDGVKAFVEITF